MNIVESKVLSIKALPQMLYQHIETCGRVCYRSEDKVTFESAEPFCRSLIKRGHEAVLEHGSLTVKIVCDRGVSHEIVRHRIAAYCQESTRYCNYSKGKFGNQISCIRPTELEEGTEGARLWELACNACENAYFSMIREGVKPENARAVLPTSLATELVITMNVREWRHFFKLRTAMAAHPDMRKIANMILKEFVSKYPALFEDCANV